MLALPAATPAPPQVFLRELDASDQPSGRWLPLAGARMHSVAGYAIGVRLQRSAERVNVRVLSVPDGHPDQKEVYPSLCYVLTGSPGQIVVPQDRVLYEGDGTYRLAVTVTPRGEDLTTGCDAGPTATGSFTAHAPTRARFVGRMVIADPSPHHAFGGLVMDAALGSSETDIRCARDPRPAPDGTLRGSLVIDRQGTGSQERPVRIDAAGFFPTVGRWACVARSAGGGVVPGPWSAPTPAENVQKGFYQLHGALRLLDARGSSVRLTDRLYPETAGGVLVVVFRRVGKAAPPVQVRTRIGSGGLAALRFRLPPVARDGPPAFFVGIVAFGGTSFVAARSPFRAIFLEADPGPGGRVGVRFTPPCAPRSC